MQTFLPYKSFRDSALCLDNKRLGKQRVEVLQIYNTLTGKSYGWKNHPAVKMWKGYEHALVEYGIVICLEWIRRGYKDTLLEKFISYKTELLKENKERINEFPKWLGDDKFHASHRSNLLRKDKKWYSQFGWKEPDDMPYVWGA